MRMEELSNSRYIKGTDQVERYLLDLISEYFKSSDISSPASREHIIKKAVQRMKEEMSFEDLGVLSIILPDGEKRTGAVKITLEDLNGEPSIYPKLSAFNVPFGDKQNTACEGNDPRLSDKRNPLPHKHDILDINGLSGKLSSLEGFLNRGQKFEHKHDNKKVLDMLIYTGDKTSIDLTLIDTIKTDVQDLVNQIRTETLDYKQKVLDKATEVETKIGDVKSEIDNLKKIVTDKNKEYYQDAKDYADKKISDAETNLNNNLSNFVTKKMLTDITNIASNSYNLIGNVTYSVQSVITNNVQDLGNDIINDILSRGSTIDKCIFNAYIEYENTYGKIIKYNLPYVFFKDNSVCGMIQTEILGNGKISFVINMDINEIPSNIYNGNIIIDVYSTSVVKI